MHRDIREESALLWSATESTRLTRYSSSHTDLSSRLLDNFFWASQDKGSNLPDDTEADVVPKVPKSLMRFSGLSSLGALFGRLPQNGSTADELMEWLAAWKQGQSKAPGLSRSWDRVLTLIEDAESIITRGATSGYNPDNWEEQYDKAELYHVLSQNKCIQRHLHKPDIASLLRKGVGELPFSFQQLQAREHAGWYPTDLIPWTQLHGATMVEFSIRLALHVPITGTDDEATASQLSQTGIIKANDLLSMLDKMVSEGFLQTYLDMAHLRLDRAWLLSRGSVTFDEVLAYGLKPNVNSPSNEEPPPTPPYTPPSEGWVQGSMQGSISTLNQSSSTINQSASGLIGQSSGGNVETMLWGGASSSSSHRVSNIQH